SQTLAQELQSQQNELQQTNEELGEKARLLAEQNAEVERKNAEVEHAKRSLEEKAAQLALTSKYKSEFLANMSHELRTPLNSLLILAQQLSDNPDENLTVKQIEYANIIRSSGNDLLNLINDILDLSKIESGTVTVDVADARLTDVRDFVERTFRHVAEGRGIDFTITVDPALPPAVRTDVKRLQQILKNFLSNAFKFTERGTVSLAFRAATSGWSADHQGLSRGGVVAIEVSDTGIGIPREKQLQVFEAFQQADGTTSRRYGGTGLGLSISRELVRLLDGEITLQSDPGRGSVFTVFLPLDGPRPLADAGRTTAAQPVVAVPVPVPTAAIGQLDDETAQVVDDRDSDHGDRPVVVVVEDDTNFAGVLVDLAREQGLDVVVARQGADAVRLVHEHHASAVTLDLRLLDMSGWTVLDQLKHDRSTAGIPVHIISVEEERDRGLRRGAATVLTKPVRRAELQRLFTTVAETIAERTPGLLLVEADPAQRQAVTDLLRGSGARVHVADDAAAAVEIIRTRRVDCAILDATGDGSSGAEVLGAMRGDERAAALRVLLLVPAEGGRRAAARLRRVSAGLNVVEARGPEELATEVGRILHSARAAQAPQAGTEDAARQPRLAGRRALVVDDDVRNIFALTAVLERCGMEAISAENGREAISTLAEDAGIDIALVDIMMPELDGYETIRAIRAIPGLRDLPIVAVTAKAMKGDREKCLEAGASDYVAKPVDADTILSLLRVWLDE
ncbi:MAG TPA: response regulator, partial [Candidatus Dormibacteraeota bacterium]|nr:response regulator [Candidatus Dormibacteraeota bacterium]